MNFEDLLRSVLGFRSRRDLYPGRSESDETSANGQVDENQTGFSSFFGKENSPFDFDEMFVHFHSDVHQQMESFRLQMEDMLKGFETVTPEHFPPIYWGNTVDKPDKDSMIFQRKSKKAGEGVRDFFLKDSEEQNPQASPSVPNATFEGGTYDRTPFQFFPQNPGKYEEIKDTDLDGKVRDVDMLDLITRTNKPVPEEKQGSCPQSLISSRSVSVTTVRGPDGTLEQKRIVKDSSGREESTVVRSLNGQTHTIRTIKDQGQEERHEEFKNTDESESASAGKWKTPLPLQPPISVEKSPYLRLDPRDRSIFSWFTKDP